MLQLYLPAAQATHDWCREYVPAGQATQAPSTREDPMGHAHRTLLAPPAQQKPSGHAWQPSGRQVEASAEAMEPLGQGVQEAQPEWRAQNEFAGQAAQDGTTWPCWQT